MSTRSYDAIVVGGGPNGLIAGACLARTGRKVILFDACDVSRPVPAHTLYALDHQVVSDLKLALHGLRFVARDLALVNLRADGKPLVLRRDVHATVAELAVQSQHDAEAWPHFRRDLFELGRALRGFWQGTEAVPKSPWAEKLNYIARTSAAAWLDSWFESDMLKAALCFDATAGGVSVLEPGSALVLVWRAAQEMSGLQAAVALPQGGMAGFMRSLDSAASALGCEIHRRVSVAKVLLDGERAVGVALESGESVLAPIVSSSLSRAETFAMLPQAADGVARVAVVARQRSGSGEALVTLTLKQPPAHEGFAVPLESRFIIADRVDTYATAQIEACRGKFAVELPMEVIVPSVMDASLETGGQHIVSVLVRPVPLVSKDDISFVSALSARVMSALDGVIPGFSSNVVNVDVSIHRGTHLRVEHMLTSAANRVTTPISGLFFCGADAEPVPAISGCAARIAAGLAGATPR